MTPEEQLELFAQFDENELYTAAMQLMRRMDDAVVDNGEEPVHADLPGAIDDLSLGPWHEIDQPLVAGWPYAVDCVLLGPLMRRLEEVSCGAAGEEAVIIARWLLRPGRPTLWAQG